MNKVSFNGPPEESPLLQPRNHVGRIFKHHGGDYYIMAQYGGERYALISLTTGLAWSFRSLFGEPPEKMMEIGNVRIILENLE